MNELELIIDLHRDAHRQGPGSERTTHRALELIGQDKIDSFRRIADIGCGTGTSTMQLAQYTRADIVAVDLFDDFLEQLRHRAAKMNLRDRITTLALSMDALPFKQGELDMIWSEGAIYNIGFANGVKLWHPYLKKGGYLALSEISWIGASRPEEIEQHWNQEYPEIDTVSGKIKVLEESGYRPVAHFILTEDCWMDNYYTPMIERFDSFLERHNHSEQALSIVEAERKEIALYLKYKEYISYGFYIVQKE